MAEEIYHIYAPQDESADTEASRAIKDQLGNVIDETYATKAELEQKSNIIKVASFSDLPEEGDVINLYVVGEHFAYSWNGTAYEQISTLRTFDVTNALTINDIDDICILHHDDNSFITRVSHALDNVNITAQNEYCIYSKQNISTSYAIVNLFDDSNKDDILYSSMFATNADVQSIFDVGE